MFKIGDRVKFLNDKGSGEIIAFAGKDMVSVMIEDGFAIPVKIADLVKSTSAGLTFEKIYGNDNTVSKKNVEQEEEEEEEEESLFLRNTKLQPPVKSVTPIAPPVTKEEMDEDISSATDKGKIYLGFMAQGENLVKANAIDCYLINDSIYRVFYAISKLEDGKLELIKAGQIETDIKISLTTIAKKSLQFAFTWQVDLIFFRKGLFEHQPPLNLELEIDPNDLLDSIKYISTDFFHEPAWLMPCENVDLAKHYAKITGKEPETKKNIVVKPAPKPVKTDMLEVDLHIEELIDNPAHLEAGEILNIQMARFETSLETAILHKLRKIVFIHGIGAGKLKYEIQQRLNKKYSHLRYQDASFKEYGYGATMVIL